MTFAGKVLAAIVLAALALLAWHVRGLVLLVLGGLLLAIVLEEVAGALQRLLHLPRKLAVAVTVLLGLLLFALLSWTIGGAVAAQLEQLGERLPGSLAGARAWLQQVPLGPRVLDSIDAVAQASVPWARIAGFASTIAGALGKLLLMLVMAVFIAAEPDLYRRGTVRLVPPRHREAADRALCACGRALAGWLKGQALSMTFVGVATGLGLALLGVPLALVLGLLAGLLDFVPFFGPIASGLLAVLLAFPEGPHTALYVAILTLAIQQLEGQLIVPLVQRWAVSLPPALGLVAVVIAAGVFGLAGVLFATPLMVVLLVLVRTLYVEEFLERRAPGAS